MLNSIRLLPVTIFVAALLLSVKVNDVWTGFRSLRSPVAVSETLAQTQPQAQPTQPVQTQGATPTRPITEAQPGQAQPPPTPRGQAQAPAGGRVPANPRADNKPLDPILFSQSEIELLQNLATRRKEIDQREETVANREILLQAAEKRLDTKIAELKKVKEEIEVLIKKYEEQEEAEIKSLVRIYETMKPKEAARIFDELDLKILLQVFQRMKEQKSAPILAVMKPERAKEITTQIAERRDMPNPNKP